ncbi:uridine diphosphate glucose pyrophosphatase NUDT22-like, partial [Saccoglossus kowalevskii]
ELLSIIGRDRKMEFQHIPMHQFPVEAVVEEMFDSIIREVRDEINIPRMALSEPQLLGVVGNVASAGRLGLDFFMRCSLTAREVTDLYCAGGPEAEESTNMKLVPLQVCKEIFII